MKIFIAVVLCKFVYFIGKKVGRGSSLPGKIVLKLFPDILSKIRMPKTVIAVSGKAVKLIDNYGIKGVFIAVRDHPLELSTVVIGTALCSVNVLTYDGVTVVCGEFVAGLELTFNGLFTLAVA